MHRRVLSRRRRASNAAQGARRGAQSHRPGKADRNGVQRGRSTAHAVSSYYERIPRARRAGDASAAAIRRPGGAGRSWTDRDPLILRQSPIGYCDPRDLNAQRHWLPRSFRSRRHGRSDDGSPRATARHVRDVRRGVTNEARLFHRSIILLTVHLPAAGSAGKTGGAAHLRPRRSADLAGDRTCAVAPGRRHARACAPRDRHRHGRGDGLRCVGQAVRHALVHRDVSRSAATRSKCSRTWACRPDIFGSGYDCSPHAILFDRTGTAYVGQAGCSGAILKFAPGQAPVAYHGSARHPGLLLDRSRARRLHDVLHVVGSQREALQRVRRRAAVRLQRRRRFPVAWRRICACCPTAA